jgi:hypothetical protein
MYISELKTMDALPVKMQLKGGTIQMKGSGIRMK